MLKWCLQTPPVAAVIQTKLYTECKRCLCWEMHTSWLFYWRKLNFFPSWPTCSVQWTGKFCNFHHYVLVEFCNFCIHEGLYFVMYLFLSRYLPFYISINGLCYPLYFCSKNTLAPLLLYISSCAYLCVCNIGLCLHMVVCLYMLKCTYWQCEISKYTFL